MWIIYREFKGVHFFEIQCNINVTFIWKMIVKSETWRKSGDATVLFIRHIATIVFSVTNPFYWDAVTICTLEQARSTWFSYNQHIRTMCFCQRQHVLIGIHYEPLPNHSMMLQSNPLHLSCLTKLTTNSKNNKVTLYIFVLGL